MGLVLLKCKLICTVQNGPKIAGCAPFWGGRAVSPSNTKSPKPGPISVPSGILIHPTIWPQQMWAKNWGDCAPLGRGAGSPSNTMWPGPRPTCIPAYQVFTLIHPTVWPQYTNVTDGTDRQDRSTVR